MHLEESVLKKVRQYRPVSNVSKTLEIQNETVSRCYLSSFVLIILFGCCFLIQLIQFVCRVMNICTTLSFHPDSNVLSKSQSVHFGYYISAFTI